MPGTPSRLGPGRVSFATPTSVCPSATELADFLDGKLEPPRRAEVLAHLADCDDCQEIVVAAAAVKTALRHNPDPQLALSGAKVLAEIVPLGTRARKAAPRVGRRWLGIAAAALLAVGVLYLAPSHRGDGGFPPAGVIVASLQETGDLRAMTADLWRGDANALGFGATLAPAKIAFRSGVLLTDFEVAAAAGDAAAAEAVVARLNPLLAGPAESSALANALAAVVRGDTEGAAADCAELAHALELRLPAQPAAFGRWTEAGRLAARARRAAYFQRADVREFPRELDAPPAPIARELRKVSETLRRGVAGEADYLALERAFEQLLLLD